MASIFDICALHRFLILLYKGLLLRKRHYIITAFEIIVPVFIASIPAIIESEIARPPSEYTTSYRKYVNDTYYPAKNAFIGPFSYYDRGEILFAYAPPNDNTHMLMNASIEIFTSNNRYKRVHVKALKDGNELENYCMFLKRNNTSLKIIGTIFNNIDSSSKTLPSDLDYTLRFADNFFSTKLKYQFSRGYVGYFSSFFLAWQVSVEKAFIEKKMVEHGEFFNYELWKQEFPFPGHKDTSRGFGVTVIIPIVVTYGFLVFVINIVRRVIEEKSNGSKELMKMMGMTDFIYWCSTFLNYFIVGIVACLIITIIYKSPLKYGAVLLPHSNFLLVFIFFLLFIASLILFCLAVTTFFNKTTFGVIFMIIIYNVSYVLLTIYVFFPGEENRLYYPLSLPVKFSICLLPSGVILSMLQIIMAFEQAGEGVHWSNLYDYDAIPDINTSLIMIATLVSCFLYILIIWYIDAVWPWQYGVPKPFYFPFTKKYWCGYEETSKDSTLLDSHDDPKSAEFFEDDPTGTSPGVIIKNLSKVFRSGFETKVAVNNVSLNIYSGQITALLGHNGAGKTTTINILTGLFAPSGGSVSINGWDIFSETIKARESLGVCPQHNILYDTLTVGEHLKIYAALKGVSWSKLEKETDSILKMLNLSDKKNELAKDLSGGMKRKLSLGIALIGGSKVLFLDEPTSGLDVEARRSVWDTLLDIRHNRTIVLTTHYMEEADILGDRIAIMADGEIQCCGSPLFLKKKFGTGYHLHLVKRENFNLHAVIEVLEKFIPSATLQNDYEGEATFNLMSNVQSNFGALFEVLESRKDTLGINSCGITVTTMEDVFLNVANIADMKDKTQEAFTLENTEETEMKEIYVESNEFGRSKTFGTQFLGLFLKRVHYAKRNWHILIPQLIIPFIIMCICLFTIKLTVSHSNRSEPPLKLDIKEIYGKTDGFYHSDGRAPSELAATEMKKVLQEKNINVQSVNNPEEFVLKYGNKSISDYYKRLIVGGSVKSSEDKLNFTAWYNVFPIHSEPISLLLMDTSILRRVTKSGYITLTNSPLPEKTYYHEDRDYTSTRILAMVFVPMGLAFLSSSFTLVPIHERTSKAKLLQLMTGVSSVTYWLSMFVWDFLTNFVVILFLIIPFAIFSHYAFFYPHSEAIGTVILIMILYGWSSIPFSYLFSLIFKKPTTGFSIVNTINVLAGVAVCTPFTVILRFAPAKENPTVKFFSWFLKLFPSYALSSGFSNLFAISYANAYCDSIDPSDLEYQCEDAYDKFNPVFKCCKDKCGSECLTQTYPITMDEDGCGRDILFLFLDGIIYFSLLLLLESPLIKMCIRYCSQRLPAFRKIADHQFINGNFVEDSDVLQEEERIKTNYEQISHNDALVVLNLSKKFKLLKAVDRLTFGVHKTECFGLLGVNGAGKTTTFRMLAGDCYPTEGNAFIGNCSVIKDLKRFQSYIGYCPQFDALIDRLSAREMITLFARLRGLSGPNMTRYVNALIKMTDLSQYADKPSMVYSGGNKRKLSIALALIGAPPLLLLDEPTAGVDPVSRRKIWKILSLARIHSGAAVILTTHSMEESEALCSRLAIMVNGRFRCLGSIQQLKTKFGQGYTLIIKLKKEEQGILESMNAAKAFIDTNLPGANLKDDHQGMLQYHVVDPSVTLSHLFHFMDNMKKAYNLEDYVISDTSLEQIFLTFARSQIIVAT